MEHPFIFKRLLYGVKRNPTRVRKMERPADEDLQPTDPTINIAQMRVKRKFSR